MLLNVLKASASNGSKNSIGPYVTKSILQKELCAGEWGNDAGICTKGLDCIVLKGSFTFKVDYQRNAHLFLSLSLSLCLSLNI